MLIGSGRADQTALHAEVDRICREADLAALACTHTASGVFVILKADRSGEPVTKERCR